MRVGIIQSCYIPWRGFFDFIDDVDLFIIFDDIQYPYGRSWRSRNQIKTPTGLKWLTVPVRAGSSGNPIDQVLIGRTEKPWRQEHFAALTNAFKSSPYYAMVMDIWREGVSGDEVLLSKLNEKMMRIICQFLRIKTPLVQSRNYAVTGEKTVRLINLLKKVGATTYLSGPTAKDYLDETMFRENGIALEYKTYDYEPYPQLWGDFVGNVTILDLIANCGSDSRKYLKSRTANTVVK